MKHVLPKTCAPTSWLVQPHGWSCIISFHFLKDVTILFLICYCKFLSGKGSSKINKSKDSSLVSLIKSFCGNTRLPREFKHQS